MSEYDNEIHTYIQNKCKLVGIIQKRIRYFCGICKRQMTIQKIDTGSHMLGSNVFVECVECCKEAWVLEGGQDKLNRTVRHLDKSHEPFLNRIVEYDYEE